MLTYLHVARTEDGDASVFDARDEFAAGLVGGNWILEHDFDDFDLEERFQLVVDDTEAVKIMEEARKARDRPLTDA